MSIYFNLDVKVKAEYKDEFSEETHSYEVYRATLELGNFRGLRTLLTMEEVENYTGRKLFYADEILDALWHIIPNSGFQVKLAALFLHHLKGEFIGDNEATIICELTWC
jgi:hypothetical protein